MTMNETAEAAAAIWLSAPEQVRDDVRRNFPEIADALDKLSGLS